VGKKKHELIPSAHRLITSLRDMGYDFSAAVADVTDNSIEALASKVEVDVHSEGDDSWVRITDNGVGMKPAQIREALRYGTARKYDAKKSLGKFGLGLKTASMSQCQHLTVASRSNPGRPEIAAHAWDLSHVMATDRWEILEVGRDDHPELWHEPLREHTGTVILWRRLDRILGFKNPYGEMAKKRLAGMCKELEEHLSMVFHRYIAGEAGRRKVRITVNGKAVRPWDPFVRQEEGTQRMEPVTLHYDHEGTLGEILIEPFVVPHQAEFSSPEAHAAAAGPLRWNRQQGFYIYRADRMIQGGGWSNLRTLDEHTKLARVALSFDPRLDDAFRINVAKMRVQLPRQLREQFEKAIAPVIKAAQAAYRRVENDARIHPVSQEGVKAARTAVRNNIDAKPSARVIPTASFAKNLVQKSGKEPGDERLWTMRELRGELDRVANSDERPIVRIVLERLLNDRSDEQNKINDVVVDLNRAKRRRRSLRYGAG
jgi:Histidine kinase-, DNA gyrase B-, and HSP90-like ATPase